MSAANSKRWGDLAAILFLGALGACGIAACGSTDAGPGASGSAGADDAGPAASEDAARKDAATADAGDRVTDAGVDGAVTCIAESDARFCARQGKNCDSLTAQDNCGMLRTSLCGNCGAPNTCSANVCLAPVGNREQALWPMPDSRTVLCTDGTTKTACPATGEPADGQDGTVQTPKSVYTTTADTVLDSMTGLMWQRAQSAAASSLHWAEAAPYCDTLDLGGYSDWRLPTSIELMSLADVGASSEQLDAVAFPTLNPATYWSASPYAFYAGNAWAVSLATGYRLNYSKGQTYPVLCVRGGKPGPASRYSTTNDLVVDLATGLMWQRGTSAQSTWLSALAYCGGLALGGYTDWRAPSIKELATLVDVEAMAPAIDSTAFPSTPYANNAYFWSASPHAYYPASAWAIAFELGQSVVYATTGAGAGNVRCVR